MALLLAKTDIAMKTRHPLILTARIADDDLAPFDRLRKAHFPPERNFLHAHLTMFHRLPGEYAGRIVETLERVAALQKPISAQVTGLRHLGAGVAFAIASPELYEVRQALRGAFVVWLNSQDMHKWQPHITIQNKVSRGEADQLFKALQTRFEPRQIRIVGLDLHAYLDGPWRLDKSVTFGA